MVQFTQATISAAAFLGLVQLCPAAFLAGIEFAVEVSLGSASSWAGAAGGIVGGGAAAANAIETAKINKKPPVNERAVINSRIKRQEEYGAKLAWELCRDDVGKATLDFSAPGPGSILVSGVPPTCMTIATTITGKFNEGNPVPMGNDAVQFNNVGDDIVQELQDALRARG